MDLYGGKRAAVVIVALTAMTACTPAPEPPPAAAPAPLAPAPARLDQIPVAAKAPRGLPTITYWSAPAGFPRDTAATTTDAVRGGLRPDRQLVVYDGVGGRPRAYLPGSIEGMPVTVPIVRRHRGWVAVLLPTLNRRIGWLPRGGWQPRTLPDQLVLDRHTRRLTWLRDGRPHRRWTVAVGSKRTPTPPGRTFVLGRTATSGAAYAGLDALALGAVPDHPGRVAAGLRDGHTGIHAWHDPAVFGHSISNGCIRTPPSAQRALLHHILPGTVVHVR
ncbi:L,D-transpeptidase [Actinoplanes sp. RD1]|uniref:L,D-transpeptidase n=1 Tax=Actinoplanes sp. RD1 TaxID=3064538 RepID=UPI00274246CF|nr:L,D-transpeptidase [Actinoplanes sp. RD1]